MSKFKLLNRASGVNKETGRPWCRVTLGCDRNDGSRSVADFFVAPELSSKLSGIPLDAFVYVSAYLDQALHFAISDIRPVEASTK